MLPFYKFYEQDVSLRRRLLGLLVVPTGNTRGQYKRVGGFLLMKPYVGSKSENHLKTVVEDIDHRAVDDAFIRFVEHENERWGVIEIV